MTPFAAVLLAGGQSRRMGRDKALLPLPDGRLLWQRQLAVLQALGPAELFIAGPPRDGFPPAVPCLTDAVPGRGPLGGIVAALRAMRSPRLVALAVDLPFMTDSYLRTLLEKDAATTVGIIPMHPADGFYEPLVGVYPKPCLHVAEASLHSNDWSLQNFVRATGARLLAEPIRSEEEALFINWNHPGDVPSLAEP